MTRFLLSIILVFFCILPMNAKKIVYPNGDVYEGEVSNKLPEGKGLMTYHDGYEYDGGWKAGKRNGFGTLTLHGKDIYVGEWANDKYNGKGTLHLSGREVYVGTFSNGLKEGQGKQDDPLNGVSYEGIFHQDQFFEGTRNDNGNITEYRGGKPSSGMYVEKAIYNKEEGTDTLAYNNGVEIHSRSFENWAWRTNDKKLKFLKGIYEYDYSYGTAYYFISQTDDEASNNYTVRLVFKDSTLVEFPLTLEYQEGFTENDVQDVAENIKKKLYNSIDDKFLYYIGINMVDYKLLTKEGMNHLKKAYGLGNDEAGLAYAFHASRTGEEAFHVFSKMEKKGNPEATYGLALCYYAHSKYITPNVDDVKDMTPDEMKKEAFRLIGLAVNRGSKEAKTIQTKWKKAEIQEQREERIAAAENAKYIREHKGERREKLCFVCGGDGVIISHPNTPLQTISRCPNCVGRGYVTYVIE